MNSLEELNMHEHILRESLVVLILKGAFAWLLMALMDYGFDYLAWLRISVGGNAAALFTSFPSFGSLTLFHLIVNFLYGWLLLYIVLAWVCEYYIIKPDSIVVRQGIIFSNENIFQMEDVKTIHVSQGFFGRILNLGTVEFYAFRAQKRIYLKNITNPSAIAADIHSMHPAPETVSVTHAGSSGSGKGRHQTAEVKRQSDDEDEESADSLD